MSPLEAWGLKAWEPGPIGSQNRLRPAPAATRSGRQLRAWICVGWSSPARLPAGAAGKPDHASAHGTCGARIQAGAAVDRGWSCAAGEPRSQTKPGASSAGAASQNREPQSPRSARPAPRRWCWRGWLQAGTLKPEPLDSELAPVGSRGTDPGPGGARQHEPRQKAGDRAPSAQSATLPRARQQQARARPGPGPPRNGPIQPQKAG